MGQGEAGQGQPFGGGGQGRLVQAPVAAMRKTRGRDSSSRRVSQAANSSEGIPGLEGEGATKARAESGP